ncbi:trehalose-phosphatase [Phyllobacterium sp. YR531]|uniref:trehalose-phosphatase n=1 Tax=Phyllobacterium sp. YR531 TaxID=1144343 RepID=UPI00026F7E9E|nr:trehalose-phosphatase [Phyllobacterium sp. YR531]EJN01682.1 trehalose-phosphatase [Phyllobacterium sp. YR531]
MKPEIKDVLPTDLRAWALFLDIDGTLIDLAPTPNGIIVPEVLPEHLSSLYKQLDGAMALVTGRSIESADAMFAPFQFPIAGMHGSEVRDGVGHQATKLIDRLALDEARQELEKLTLRWPQTIIEDKGLAIAVHYRQVPEAERAVQATLSTIHSKLGDGWKLQSGKMVVELLPSGTDKGSAIADFMSTAPYKGRRPLAIGDDLTDEAMFRFVNGSNGRSVRVGTPLFQSDAQYEVNSANDVRSWIAALANSSG